MHPALTALPPAAALQPPPASPVSAPGLQFAQLAPGGLPTASAQDRAEFVRASAPDAQPTLGAQPEVRAELPSLGGGIGDRLMQHMEQLTHRLGGLQNGAVSPPSSVMQPGAMQPGAPPTGTPAPARPGDGAPQATGLDRAGMDGAIAQIERAYMFAIETTMVSRGSTESTKIFNTLLKGQ